MSKMLAAIEKAIAWENQGYVDTPQRAYELGLELGTFHDRMCVMRVWKKEWYHSRVSATALPRIKELAAAYGFELTTRLGPDDDKVMVDVRNPKFDEPESTEPSVREIICDALKAFVDNSADQQTEPTKLYLTTQMWDAIKVEEDMTDEEAAEGRDRGQLLGLTVEWDAPEFKVE